ncbi:MAG: aldo/keto reductase [Desulfopila sp.]|jgi:predicted aldo/keto reductase-like oxidoreductase|nr:aldo/keto reductase [Desulfopila sp.]
MLYREFGKTGEKVSNLGFGCMRLPIVGQQEENIEEKLAAKMLRDSIDQGVNYVDTAYPYHKGMSEPFVGRALQNGYRKKVFIATKLPPWDVNTPEDCGRIFNEQLKRLQTEYIDFYLLHALKKEWWNKLVQLGALEFLDKEIRDGRIRYAGFSFHDELEQFKVIADGYDWSFCQIQYNFMDEEVQAGTAGLKYAADKKLGVVVMEPLRGGSLARRAPEDIQALWDEAPQKRSSAEWALRWIWNHPEVSVVLSGMTTPEQVEENCRIAASAEAQALSEIELEIIEKVKEQYRKRIKIDCTSCGYCMPCPNGVNIPRIFSLFNDRFIFEEKRWSHMMYIFSSNNGEQATNCIECGECEESCPQSIAIMAKLKECHKVLSEPLE